MACRHLPSPFIKRSSHLLRHSSKDARDNSFEEDWQNFSPVGCQGAKIVNPFANKTLSSVLASRTTSHSGLVVGEEANNFIQLLCVFNPTKKLESEKKKITDVSTFHGCFIDVSTFHGCNYWPIKNFTSPVLCVCWWSFDAKKVGLFILFPYILICCVNRRSYIVIYYINMLCTWSAIHPRVLSNKSTFLSNKKEKQDKELIFYMNKYVHQYIQTDSLMIRTMRVSNQETRVLYVI